MTTRGFKEEEFKTLAHIIIQLLQNTYDENIIKKSKEEVSSLTYAKIPVKEYSWDLKGLILEENIVAEEFQKGYMYRDHVVRHSMVKVANWPHTAGIEHFMSAGVANI